ncbi:MAG TPA: hypothetical protein VMX13_01860 [Sedimentisphaerales bacterium]|nr:hypothetical protein [Sedimentisphaerales bacterium]
MIRSRKHRLVMAVLLVGTCTLAVSQEANEGKTELEFEISGQPQSWFIKMPAAEPPVTGAGPIKPTHVAELFLWNLPSRVRSRDSDPYLLSMDLRSAELIRKLNETPAGQRMSPQQRDFLTTGDALITVGNFSDTVGNHWHFRLYAVSQDDAKQVAQALLEFVTEIADERLQQYRDEQQKLQEKVGQLKKEIPEEETKLKATQTKLEQLKKTVHYLSISEAKDTVVELNKKLDDLNIEIAGLRAELEATSEAIGGPARGPFRDKLEEIRIEQMIKLKATEAKKDTATKIRDQAETFFRLVNELSQFAQPLSELRSRLGNCEQNLRQTEYRLANPSMEMLPPEVFQNKVTIYRVGVGE